MSVREFIQNARRVLKLAKKPERKEIWLTAKVCALGIALIGAFAFVIHLIFIVVGFHP
jgi:protein transport protein SEC61 subunit gamma and related proteins